MVDELRVLALKLVTNLKEARDRLHQNPENSSRPPSTRLPWERARQDDAIDDGDEDKVEAEQALTKKPAEDTEETEEKPQEPTPKILRSKQAGNINMLPCELYFPGGQNCSGKLPYLVSPLGSTTTY